MLPENIVKQRQDAIANATLQARSASGAPTGSQTNEGQQALAGAANIGGAQ